MINVYLVLFLVGFLFTLCSFLLGHIGGGGDHDAGGIDSHGADLHGADLHGIDAHGVDVHGIDAHGIDAHGIDIHEVDAHSLDAHSADLHGADIHADSGGWGFSPGMLLPLRPSSFMLLITAFGGVGYILTRLEWPFAKTLIIALSVGYVLSVGINCLIDYLRKSYNTSAYGIDEAIGLNADVVSRIMDGGFGRISYVIEGRTLSAPARCESGGVAQGTQVKIKRIDKDKVFWVEPI